MTSLELISIPGINNEYSADSLAKALVHSSRQRFDVNIDELQIDQNGL